MIFGSDMGLFALCGVCGRRGGVPTAYCTFGTSVGYGVAVV